MNPGKLRQLLRIETPAEAQNATGEAIETWTHYATVYGALEPLRGRELYQAQAVQSEITAKATIRYRSGVTSKMRIVHGGLTYNIAAPPIDPASRGEVLELMLSQGLRD